MANWKNLIDNPPKDLGGYYIFKIVSLGDESKWNFVHGCIKPPKDDSELLAILFPKEQSVNLDKVSMFSIHTVNPEQYKYLYVNLHEIL